MTREQAHKIAREMEAALYRFVCIFRAESDTWEAAGRNRQTGELVIISQPEQWQALKAAENAQP